MDVAIPVITDDVQIVNDCSHLMWIPEKFTESPKLFLDDQIIPENFEKNLEKVREEVKKMQDQDQGAEEDVEGEFYDEQEQKDEAHFDSQIIHFTEPTLNRQKLSRGNSATVIMMGREEAEQFLSSRLSHNAFFQQNRGSVKYASKIPEPMKQLKSLKTFKEKGRWKLMPKENERNDCAESENGDEYPEYDDFEDELENDYYEEILDSPCGSRNTNKISWKDRSPPSSPKNRDSNRISITNLNKFYKK